IDEFYFIQAEDGIRYRNVTGVQRCALPISIRLVVYDIGVSTQRIEHALCDVPGTTISAVQTNLDTLEGIDTQRDQITHVTVASRSEERRVGNKDRTWYARA